MAEVLVRDLDSDIVERLKSRAKRHGRSLQGEAKAILEAAATYSTEEALRVTRQWRQRLTGQIHGDSSDLIREDRDR